jgi:phage/plasmid-like protein (TIGR03299 family)
VHDYSYGNDANRNNDMHEVETMAFANQVPWHGLGVQVDARISPDEMVKAAGLDWTINPHPLFTTVDGETIRVPDKRCFVRSSDKRVMTISGPDWTPVQNTNLLGFFREYTEAGGMTLETAGSLREGTVVWALASLGAGFTVGKTDKHRAFLLMTGSHKVGVATTARTTDIRVVCANTMAAANADSTIQYKQSHLNAFDVKSAKLAVEKSLDQYSEFGKRMNRLATKKINPDDTFLFLQPIFAPAIESKTREEFMQKTQGGNALRHIMHSIDHAPGAVPGTLYGVLQGVTHWADHVNGQNAASRMFRSWVGDIGKTKLTVESKLMAMV